jgi:peptidoglycan/xylan/chitin deacetylase (PgdA/CDA1 family)
VNPWVCLMYHDVAAEAPGVSGGKGFFAVSAQGFASQLDQMADLGYHACTVEQALAAAGTERRAALTFDDGDAGQYERAFPALARRGMAATFFVTTGWVGRPGYASWDALREMKAAGMSVQSHTRTHPFLSELGREALREELYGSRAELDDHLGQRTQALALPGGDPPRAGLRGALAEAGYTVIATSRWGVNRHWGEPGPVWVRRCTVRGTVPAADFRRILEGDRLLGWRRRLREGALGGLRTSMGPSRYARWRRRFLDLIGTEGA